MRTFTCFRTAGSISPSAGAAAAVFGSTNSAPPTPSTAGDTQRPLSAANRRPTHHGRGWAASAGAATASSRQPKSPSTPRPPLLPGAFELNDQIVQITLVL